MAIVIIEISMAESTAVMTILAISSAFICAESIA